MAIPKQCGLAPLTQNVEGLRSHALLASIFMPEPEISSDARKWRSWLIRCLVKTARHYNDARNLVLEQISERERPASAIATGRALPILDFALSMEDCITSLDKAVVCIHALEKKGHMSGGRVLALERETSDLKSFRNQQEHMHINIAAGQTGDGPIYVMVSDNGDVMKFRDLKMSFAALYRLIDAAYLDIAGLFPGHDVNSTPNGAGVPKISMTLTMEEVSPGHPPKQIL